MDINEARLALKEFAERTIRDKTFINLGFNASRGETPSETKQVNILVPDNDFVLGDKTMFTSEEAFLLQELGKEFGLRLPRKHECRGMGFWITHNGLYYGVTKFNLDHAGHTWAGTNIPQVQDSGAYYWTGSSERGKFGKKKENPEDEHAYAMRLLPLGQFDIVSRPATESMKLRLIIDPLLLPESMVA